MADINFIEFRAEPFFIERTSQYIEHYEVRGLQLLPNNPLPYIQTTNVAGGIELEDWTVYAVKCDDTPVIALGSQNLLLHSESADDVVWVNNQLEVTPDNSTFGDISFNRIVATSSNAPHWITQTITKDAVVKTYTVSCYVQAAEYSRLYLRVSESGGDFFTTYFNINTEAFTNTQASGVYTNTELSYTNEGSGVYRVYATITTGSAVSLDVVFGIVDDNDDFIFIGDNLSGTNLSGLNISAMQLQEGSLGNYLVTTSTAVIESATETLGTDITDYFLVESIFTDENGDNQFVWSLTNVPFDFGYDLVYLKATQTIGETFYSNWFLFTENESNITTRIDYKAYNSEYMQSIQLPMAFKQEFSPVEIETYYETSTKNTVINTVKEQNYESWLTNIISNDLLLRMIKVFTYKFTYLNLLRCNLFEAIEQQEYEAAENFTENIIKLTFNKSDVYNPLIANIPVVEPLIPSITLSSVQTNGITNAVYSFVLANFTPDTLVYQYSSDEINWTSVTNDEISPKTISFNGTGTWYFRITHPQAISNTITVALGSTVIANNDSYVVAKGSTTDFQVLLNDTLVGTTTITGVSIPTNGTATIVGNILRYVHNDSETLSDGFTYTIGNGLTSDTATVSVEILVSTAKNIGITLDGTVTKEEACALSPELGDFIFIGAGDLSPKAGDVIYYAGLPTLIPFDGGDLWYQIEGFRSIQINNEGVVIAWANC